MKYPEYEGKQVNLADVLELLDERVDAMMYGLIGATEIDEETLRQKLGKIQGMRLALNHVRSNFGAAQ